VLVVLDRSRERTQEDQDLLAATAARPRVVVLNKSDLPDAAKSHQQAASSRPGDAVDVSAKTGAGIDHLIDVIASALSANEPVRDQPQITNIRHAALLERAGAAIDRAAAALGQVSEEFPLLDLQEASQALQEITGQRTSDDLLRHIFERFCIGK
jgi:tRNA modification GTPase